VLKADVLGASRSRNRTSSIVPDVREDDDGRIDIRVPVWNTAALILVATAMAAVNLYTSPGIGARVITVLAGIAALVGAFIAYRMYLVADDDGVGVRGLWRTESIDWPDLADVGIIEHRVTTMRLQLERKDGTVVNVPQSLTTPSKPTSKPVARARLETLGRAILDYPDKHRTNSNRRA
jgi:hypothetical protein